MHYAWQSEKKKKVAIIKSNRVKSCQIVSRGCRLKVPTHRILKTWSTLQVTIKGIGDIEDALDVFHAQRLALVDSESLRGADGILDLLNC